MRIAKWAFWMLPILAAIAAGARFAAVRSFVGGLIPRPSEAPAAVAARTAGLAARIQPGMSLPQVEALLGPALVSRSFVGADGAARTSGTYLVGDDAVIVEYQDAAACGVELRSLGALPATQRDEGPDTGRVRPAPGAPPASGDEDVEGLLRQLDELQGRADERTRAIEGLVRDARRRP